jgi:hypothetical protein
LEHLVVKKKEIRDQFEELVLICGGFLEHRGMGGGHGVGEENPKRRFKGARMGNGSSKARVI